MATKSFAINKEPHVAEIGDDLELRFQPEVMGDQFMDAYQALRETQRDSGVDLDKLADVQPDALRRVSRSLRKFLSELMLEDSADLLLRVDVQVGGEVIDSYLDLDEATARAEELGDAQVVHRLRLPDRVLVQLMEWVIELYSGGQRPPTQSSGSSSASKPPGTRGTGSSRSMGSTRARGR
ncbi:hypothetical protein [Streptomyces sp. NPDC007346]|uniref:hypothetical protein n=1 Tax=Streptomyces sp. NPDC007346 TaxID=3154682 RepID=UPI003452EB70